MASVACCWPACITSNMQQELWVPGSIPLHMHMFRICVKIIGHLTSVVSSAVTTMETSSPQTDPLEL